MAIRLIIALPSTMASAKAALEVIYTEIGAAHIIHKALNMILDKSKYLQGKFAIPFQGIIY